MGTDHRGVLLFNEEVPGADKQWEQSQELPDGAAHRVKDTTKEQSEPSKVPQRKEPIGVKVDISEADNSFLEAAF
jgi:hypothetical protein